MKSIFFVLFLLLTIETIFGEGTDKPSEDNATISPKKKNLSLIEKNLHNYQDYHSFSNFQVKTAEDEDYELYYYNWFTNGLEMIEKDMMKFYFSQLKYNYDKKKKNYQEYSINFFKNNFFAKLNLSESGLPYFLKERLEKINEVYVEFYKAFLSIGIPEEDLEELAMKTKVLDSVVLYSIGGKKSLEKAISNFEFVIGLNVDKIEYVKSDKNKEVVYKYLISLYKEIAKYYFGREDIQRRNRNLLYYRWKLTLLINKKNQGLKEYKLDQLIKKYYSYMNDNSVIFNNLYKDRVLKFYRETKDKGMKKKLMYKFGAKFFDPNMELD